MSVNPSDVATTAGPAGSSVTGRDGTDRPPVAGPPPPRRRHRINPAYYWMVAPALVLFFIFHTIPVLQGIYYSFTDSAGYGSYDIVGFRNYLNLFGDGRVLDAYGFTFKFAIAATILVNVIALGIALGLNAKIKLQSTLRGIFFLPNVLAILIVGYVFNFMFANTVPWLGQKLGSEALSTNLLASPNLAWLAILFVTVWQAVAFNVLIYLAGLQTVPTEVYEAATVDGAGHWRQFQSLTFPLILPFFTINMVLSLKGFLQVFDQIVALTNGGPGTATTSVAMLIYKGGFQGGEFAYQTANAVVYFIVIVVLSLTQMKFLQSRERDI